MIDKIVWLGRLYTTYSSVKYISGWKRWPVCLLFCPMQGIRSQSWILDSTLWIPDSRYLIRTLCNWNLDSEFQSLMRFESLALFSGFQSPGFRILQEKKFPGSMESGFPNMGPCCSICNCRGLLIFFHTREAKHVSTEHLKLPVDMSCRLPVKMYTKLLWLSLTESKRKKTTPRTLRKFLNL